MSATPVLGILEFAEAQAQPDIPINTATRTLEVFARAQVLSIVTAPPGAPADGSAYLVGAGTGDFSGKDRQIAWRYGGAWKYLTPADGWRVWVVDEKRWHLYVSSLPKWQPIGAPFSKTVTEAGTSVNITRAHIGAYVRMTSSSANAFNLLRDSSVDIPIDCEGHVRMAGTGQTTIVAGTGVTINGPLTLDGQHSVVTWKKVAADTYDVMGKAT